MKKIILFLVIFTVTGCGYQLRGSNLESLRKSSVYLNYSHNTNLVNEVRRQLEFADVPLANGPNDAGYVLDLRNEHYRRDVLTVSAKTGKVEEYLLTYEVIMSVTDSGGNKIIDSSPVKITRDYTFDEDSVLGKFNEEDQLKLEMSKHVADYVLRRLQTVTK